MYMLNQSEVMVHEFEFPVILLLKIAQIKSTITCITVDWINRFENFFSSEILVARSQYTFAIILSDNY